MNYQTFTMASATNNIADDKYANVLFKLDRGEVSIGHVVKIVGSNIVAPCEYGDDFVGVITNVFKNGTVSVKVAGAVSVSFSEFSPAVGRRPLFADGKGGVCFGNARYSPRFNVLWVDKPNNKIGILI